ncbi:MAG: hypothetical protein ABTD50_05280 [Polyangiaceae bacterium]
MTADPQRLAEGLDSFLAIIVLSDRANIVARAAPYLARGMIWDLGYAAPDPFFTHIGQIPGAPSTEVNNSASFVAFARAAGLRLETNEARTVYVRTYVDFDPTTLTIVESSRDVRFIVPATPEPQMPTVSEPSTPEELQRTIEEGDRRAYLEDIERRRFLETSVLPNVAPLCLRGDGPYWGVIHVIERSRTLVRIEVRLRLDGTIDTHRVVLTEQVPVMTTLW